jgi:hypothetical protein
LKVGHVGYQIKGEKLLMTNLKENLRKSALASSRTGKTPFLGCLFLQKILKHTFHEICHQQPFPFDLIPHMTPFQAKSYK